MKYLSTVLTLAGLAFFIFGFAFHLKSFAPEMPEPARAVAQQSPVPQAPVAKAKHQRHHRSKAVMAGAALPISPALPSASAESDPEDLRAGSPAD